MSSLKRLDDKALAKKYAGAYYNAAVLAVDFRDRLRLPSRCLALNEAIGGGLCYGTITELIGYESTGKTLLAEDFAVVAQQLGGVVLIDDAERAFDLQWAEQNGLELDKLEVLASEEVEMVGDWVKDMAIKHRSRLTNNEPILFICDSIAALETKNNLDADMMSEKAQMGNRAKAIYNFYRKRNNLFAKLGITVIMINQVRKKMNASIYEASETTPGGESTKFYASLRILLHAGKQIKGLVDRNGKFKESTEKGQKMGRNVSIEILKNKTAPLCNRLKAEVYFRPERYGYVGFNRYQGLRELLVDKGIVELKGSRYYYGGEMICNGEANFTPMLHEKPKLRKKLLKELNLNTPATLLERLGTMGKNLYKVNLKDIEDGDGED